VLDWLTQTQCDVLALQELKLDHDSFPLEKFAQLGYNCVWNGQKTYNGVAIISKHSMTDVVLDIPGFPDPQKRVITATVNGIRVVCAYVVNGESVGSEKFTYKLSWLKELHNYLAQELVQSEYVTLLGDFNIAPDDIDVYDPVALNEQILCSKAERIAWQDLLSLGLYDSFRLFNTEPKQYSWWDYRNLAFRRKLGLRIDHILINDKLKSLATNCIIDTGPRRLERPSDHAPVVLTLDK
jgi:exodeoxyribonuclease-3